jgi:hypothetical protein
MSGDLNEHDQLVAKLRESGVRYLVPTDARADESQPLNTLDLLNRLAEIGDPRLRHSMIGLFILHSNWADFAEQLAALLQGAARIELIAHYMAAVYLQRMWRTRLSFYLDVQLLPDLFSKQLDLPSPEDRFGKTGLHALANWHAAQTNPAFNHLSSYEHVMDLLFDQLEREASAHEPA